MDLDVEQIARVAHEANAAYCRTIGDATQKDWSHAEIWQVESARKGVRFALDHPGAPPSAQHEAWMLDLLANGWKFGTVKDAAKKEHPCLVPFAELPAAQRVKDFLFRGVVFAFQMAACTETPPEKA
jgi:RyR domain